MTRVLFWSAVAAVVYSYVVFPALVLVRAALRPRPHRAADVTPSVSVLIAARNEAAVISAKVDSVLASDYPADRLSIVIASDGSEDETVREASRPDPRVTVLDLPRVGKGAALDAAVRASAGEILVMSDANSMFAPDAIRRIVRPFADPEVGGVAGNQVYRLGGPSGVTESGERSYWDIDRLLKTAQSEAGNVIAATGALYALRRRHVRPIPPGVTDDFYLSLAVIEDGSRLVFAPDAIAYEELAPSPGREYRRKVRIMTRGLRCVALFTRVLDPRRTGLYALDLFSHKVLMRTMGLPLVIAAVSSLALAPRGGIYRLAAVVQVAFYALAAVGHVLSGSPLARHRLVALPAYFTLVQVASLHALWNLMTGRRYERWEPGRAADEAGRSPTEDEARG